MPRLRNGLAGEPISKPATKAYRDGWERVFGKDEGIKLGRVDPNDPEKLIGTRAFPDDVQRYQEAMGIKAKYWKINRQGTHYVEDDDEGEP